MPCCPGLIWDRAGTNWGCISLLYNTTLGRECTVYSTQCVVSTAVVDMYVRICTDMLCTDMYVRMECTAMVDMYIRTYVRTCTYVPDSTGREGCFRFTKRLINFSLAVTSHVNACTFYTFSIFTRVLSDVTRSDVLVPTYVGISFSRSLVGFIGASGDLIAVSFL